MDNLRPYPFEFRLVDYGREIKQKSDDAADVVRRRYPLQRRELLDRIRVLAATPHNCCSFVTEIEDQINDRRKGIKRRENLPVLWVFIILKPNIYSAPAQHILLW